VNALEVDCTGFVVAALYNAVTEPETGKVARIVTELPNTLTAALPVIQVFRIGGPNDAVILDIPTMTLHGFAATQKQANRVLHAAHTTLVGAIGRVFTLDGGRAVMTRVRVLGGPAWAAYENTDVRHAILTIQPRIKITR
jgi:hypothetical protein